MDAHILYACVSCNIASLKACSWFLLKNLYMREFWACCPRGEEILHVTCPQASKKLCAKTLHGGVTDLDLKHTLEKAALSTSDTEETIKISYHQARSASDWISELIY